MVRLVEPEPELALVVLLPPPLSLSSLPQAATPNDSAASRQPEAARFRTRNVSPPQGIDSGVGASLNRVRDAAQWSPLHTTRWKCGLTTVWVLQTVPELAYGMGQADTPRVPAGAPGRRRRLSADA